ncbi:MAG: hypothetical protein ACPG7F_01420 [Aggregatilineales bacterium]
MLSVMLIFVGQSAPVSACTNAGPSFYIEEMHDGEVVVYASVVEAEDHYELSYGYSVRGFNAILRVHHYLKGQGDEYLAVMRYRPALHSTHSIRGYDMRCTFGGEGSVWQTGTHGYFTLTSRDDGTYYDHNYTPHNSHLLIENGEVNFYSEDNPDLSPLPVAEFEAHIMDMLGTQATREPYPSRYPLKRFLNITTESGNRYRMNPDYSVTWLDPETTPLVISDDGSHVVFRYEEGLGFQYYHQEIKTEQVEGFINGRLTPQPGIMPYFSPNSSYVAVQEADHITVYILRSNALLDMQSITRQEADWLADEPTIVWSADSSTVAFQDAEGIHVLNLFKDSEWEQVTMDDDVVLHHISTSGRYVSYQQGDVWRLLDRETDDLFENAVATPDEQNLIYFGERHGSRGACTLPLRDSCPIELDMDVPDDIFWYKHEQIALMRCDDEYCFLESKTWQLALQPDFPMSKMLWEPSLLPAGGFAYHKADDLVVRAVEDTIIEFGFYSRGNWYDSGERAPRMDHIDLSDELDSPIVDLKWGQPIFYTYQP